VFAILTQVSDLPEDKMRALTDEMDDLDLLEIPALASLRQGDQAIDSNQELAGRVLEIFQEKGFQREQAECGLGAISDAAIGLMEHFSGKVQNYLRSYGELMLKDLGRTFQFSTLSEADVGTAFTYWFQNALNLPLSLLDKNVRTFCEQHGLEPEQLIAAADELDLNLAVVDDLAQISLAPRTASKESPPGASAV
jgi:hypothetical protein